jgi:hypothetical protein
MNGAARRTRRTALPTSPMSVSAVVRVILGGLSVEEGTVTTRSHSPGAGIDRRPRTHADPRAQARSTSSPSSTTRRRRTLTNAGSNSPSFLRTPLRTSARTTPADGGSIDSYRTPPTSSGILAENTCDESFRTKERRTIEIPIEPSTRWLAQMQAGHTSAAPVTAARIEWTAVLRTDHIVEELVKRPLIHAAKATRWVFCRQRLNEDGVSQTGCGPAGRLPSANTSPWRPRCWRPADRSSAGRDALGIVLHRQG